MKAVTALLNDPKGKATLWFVHWFCSWIGRLMSWIGGCECHPVGEQQGCRMRGRRIKFAHRHASEQLRRGLAEASAWTAGAFGGHNDLFTEAQAVVRFTFAYGLRKIDFCHLSRGYWQAWTSQPCGMRAWSNGPPRLATLIIG